MSSNLYKLIKKQKKHKVMADQIFINEQNFKKGIFDRIKKCMVLYC